MATDPADGTGLRQILLLFLVTLIWKDIKFINFQASVSQEGIRAFMPDINQTNTINFIHLSIISPPLFTYKQGILFHMEGNVYNECTLFIFTLTQSHYRFIILNKQ